MEVYAIKLNNIGVSLLERRCYEQATRTFADALRIVDRTLHQHVLNEKKAAVSPAEAEHLIFRASLFLSSAFESDDNEDCVPPSLQALDTIEDGSFSSLSSVSQDEMFTITNQYGDDMSLSRSTLTLNHSSVQEDLALEEEEEEEPLHLHPATIVYYQVSTLQRRHQHLERSLLSTILHNCGQAWKVTAGLSVAEGQDEKLSKADLDRANRFLVLSEER